MAQLGLGLGMGLRRLGPGHQHHGIIETAAQRAIIGSQMIRSSRLIPVVRRCTAVVSVRTAMMAMPGTVGGVLPAKRLDKRRRQPVGTQHHEPPVPGAGWHVAAWKQALHQQYEA